jgi:transposase
VDTLKPGLGLEEARGSTHGDEDVFGGVPPPDAVELYRTTPSAIIARIAADLGIMDTTLSGGSRPPGCRFVGSPDRRRRPHHPMSLQRRKSSGSGPGSRRWRDSERTLPSERDILRAAAKYFAGETNW